MSLVRSQRAQQEQTAEVDQELLMQNEVLGQISEVKNLVVSLRVALLGGVHNDIEMDGRLPMAEADVRDLKLRVKSLEDDRIRWKAYATAAAAIGGFTGTVVTLAVESFVHLVTKH